MKEKVAISFQTVATVYTACVTCSCIAIHDYMSKRDALYCIRFDNVSTENTFPIPNSY